MLLKTHCLPLLITLISLSSSCFGSYREDPFHNDFRQGHAYRRPTTYHPYYRTFGVSNQRNYHNPNSVNLFNHNNQIWSRLDGARAPVTPKVVNVDDFGAKANGRDDSQVPC